MVAFGLLVGIAYFTYSKPLYQAKSLVFIQAFGAPVRDRELPGMSVSRVTRDTLGRLASQELKIRAAQRLGILGDISTIEDFGRHIPKVRFGLSDPRHIEVTVLAYSPEVTREFCRALVAEFQAAQEEGWEQFREEALARYTQQMEELDQRISENIDEISELERSQQFTEAKFEQKSMLEIPKELVRTREQLIRMDSIKGILAKYDQKVLEGDDVLFMLSLLSGFEKDSGLTVGQIVSPSSPDTTATLTPSGEAHVVIPAQVEGLEAWRELEKRKRNLEEEIKEASEIFLPEHPKMKELEAELSKTERSLVTEMEVMRQKFDLEYTRLEGNILQLEARIPEFQTATDEFGRSQNAFTSAEQSKLMWVNARKRLSEKLSTLSFIDEYDWVELQFKRHTSLRDEVPVAPAKKKIAILGVLFGIAGALGLPTLLNLLDTSARNLPQMETLLGFRGLGIVPLTNTAKLEAVHRSPAQGATVPNYLLECFRVIRANIGLDADMSNSHPSQVILVTSARPQEGKTTQAANLAWAFHSKGERVLLVDCDLRRGRVHTLLSLDNSAGVSQLLLGEISAQEAVLDTQQDGFDAIPRGPIIPGVTELLCQSQFEKLVTEWKTQYDRVILDCPPVLGLSESASLQRVADGIVLVIRSEKTSTKDVRDSVDLLRKTGAYFFGFVLNGVDLSKVGNYYQYYYYSAPYYDQFEDETEAGKVSPSSQTSTPSSSSEVAVEFPGDRIAYSIGDSEMEESFENELESNAQLQKIVSRAHSDDDDLWDEADEMKSWIGSSKDKT